MVEYLFVYGTLRAGSGVPAAEALRRYAHFYATAHTRGRLYLIDHYPGLVPAVTQAERVSGEVYRVTKPVKLFRWLDTYEECTAAFPRPHEYQRKKVPVHMDSGGRLFAWAYVYNRSVAGRARITSGDFLPYLSKQSPRCGL